MCMYNGILYRRERIFAECYYTMAWLVINNAVVLIISYANQSLSHVYLSHNLIEKKSNE